MRLPTPRAALIGVLTLAVTAAAAPACFDTKADRSALGESPPGLTDICYTGPAETRDVGQCRPGFNVNYLDETTGTIQSICLGQVTPVPEVCDTLDNDCNGLADDGGVCAVEAIANIEAQAGDVAVVTAPDRVGPAMISKPTWGAIAGCGSMEPTECAVAFMAANRGAYGLVEPFQELRLSRTEGDAVYATVHFRQHHHSLPLSDGWAMVTVSGGKVVSAQARVMPSPPVTAPAPALTQDQAADSLVGASEVVAIGPTYLVLVEPEAEPAPGVARRTLVSRYRSILAYRFELRSAEGRSTEAYVDADTGEIVQINTLEIEDVVLTGAITDSATGNPPSTAIQDYISQTAQDFADLATHDGWLLETMIDGGLDYFLNHTEGSCETTGVSGFFNGSAVHNCTGTDITTDKGRNTFRHELGHWIVDDYWNGGYQGQGADSQTFSATFREHNSLVDYFSNFGAETLECYQHLVHDRDNTDCEFYHNSDTRDYDDLFTMEDFDDDLDRLADDQKYLLRYSDNRVVGSALNALRKDWADVHSDAEALSRMAALFFGSFPNLGGGTMTYLDYYLAIQQTCMFRFAAPGATLTVLGDDATYMFTEEDCGDVAAKFIEVGVADACGLSFPEVCDGVDNDCDGYVDNAPGVAEDFSLNRPCYSGNFDLVGIGACVSGVQACEDGAFAEACVGEVLPAPEVCDLVDNDCDRQVDEGVQTEFAYDADGDDVPGPAGHVFACAGDEGDGYVPYTVDSLLDCDDTDEDVYPGAPEQCGDLADDNCNGLVDEGCECDPTVQATRFCGPVASGCANDPFDSARVIACTRGDAASCRVGASVCEPDPVDGRLRWSSVCYGAAYGTPELCDGRDNNCDGAADNNIADFGPGGIMCGYQDAGTLQCSGGNVSCVGAPAWPIGQCQYGQASNAETPFDKTPLSFYGAGDLDFGVGGDAGEGIDVTGTVSVSGVGTSQVTATWSVNLREQKPDHTQANAAGTVVLASAPGGCQISGIWFYTDDVLYASTTSLAGELLNTGSKTFTWSTGPVASWQVWGDDGSLFEPSDDDYAGSKIIFRGPTFRFCCNTP